MSHHLTDYFSLQEFEHATLWKEGEAPWFPLKVLKDYLAFQTLGYLQSPIPQGVHLEHPELISIGSNVLIEPGVFIQGPCIIGTGTVVRHGAYIRAYTIIGSRCVIGHSTEIKHSILLDGAAATHFVYLGDSIVGRNVNLGAGVKCANLRLDRKLVPPTGLKKFGALIGDDVQIGCNAVLNPGTLIGKKSVCYPLSMLRGVIPPHSQVRTPYSLEIEPLAKHLLEHIVGKLPQAH